MLKLRNKKFGKLTVLAATNKRSAAGHIIWQCRCKCGKERLVPSGELQKGSVKSCGNHSLNPLTGFNRLYTHYKYNAKYREYSFTLSKKQFYSIVTANCFYCGISPQQYLTEPAEKFLYNGIDRIDNNKGYIRNNVVACCKVCNNAKASMSKKEFIQWVRRISIHLDRSPEKI